MKTKSQLDTESVPDMLTWLVQECSELADAHSDHARAAEADEVLDVLWLAIELARRVNPDPIEVAHWVQKQARRGRVSLGDIHRLGYMRTLLARLRDNVHAAFISSSDNEVQ